MAAVLPSAIGQSSWRLVGQVAELTRDALVTIPVHHPARRRLLESYGTAVRAIAEQHDLGVVETAISVVEDFAGRPGTDLGSRLDALWISVRLQATRHRRTPSPMTLKSYSQALHNQLSATPDGHPTKPLVIAELVTALVSVSQLGLGVVEQDGLEDALKLIDAAVLMADGPHAWHVLMTRAAVQYLMYEAQPTNVAALSQAVADLRTCLGLVPPEDVTGLGQIRLRLGTALYQWHFQTGLPADLLEAVDLLRQAHADLAADRHESTMALSNLAAAALVMQEVTGDERWHRDGLAAGRAALAGCEGMDGDEATALENTALHLLRRFERTGDTASLDDALGALESVVTATPRAGWERARRLCGLASAIALSYKVRPQVTALDRAVRLAREALAVVPPGHHGRSHVLTELGSRLRAYYPVHKDIGRIEEAVDLLGEALACTAHTSPDLVTRQLNYAGALLHWFGESRDARLLEVADDVTRDALNRTPADHSARATALLARGMVLHQLSSLHPDDETLAADALERFEAAAYTRDSPYRQIDAARKAAHVASGLQEWQRSARLLAHAVSLLPRLASRRLYRFDQERLLADFSGMVREACAHALQAGDPIGALAVLERGRGILHAQVLEDRDDLAGLREQHPELAARMDACRARMNRSPITGSLDLGAVRDDVHAAAGLWEALVEEARRLDGFERLFGAPDLADLSAIADEGPIVMINIAALRTDALLLTTTGLQVVELPHAGAEQVRERYLRFMAALEQPKDQFEHDLVGTLEWLWDAVAEPVLTCLGIVERDHGEQPRRLWWSPTGSMVFLPLHAAGRHRTKDDAVPLTVIDRVVSSYTPTLRSLLHARSRPATAPEETRRLIVAVPNPPGESPIRSASREAEYLRALTPSATDVLEDEHAVRGAILDALPHYEQAHFACHAWQDVRMPTAGHLVVHDHETAPLAVRDIAGLDLVRADFAYLSACSTGRGGVALTEESIHLASAFQIAGYRHVVATLWPVGDRIARSFTTAVYRRITVDGPSRAAHALHDAAKAVRGKHPHSPRAWASHFHTGA